MTTALILVVGELVGLMVLLLIKGEVGGGVEGSWGGGERCERRFLDEGLIDGSSTGHDDSDGLVGFVTGVLKS